MSATDSLAIGGNSKNSLGSVVPKPEARSLKEQEYLSIKHALPKTRISHAILHENTSQDRHLNMKLNAISHRQNKLSNTFDQNKRNFIETQLRKHKKWKSQDEMGAATMNFTNLRSDSSRRPSMVVVYQSPQYYEKKEDAVREAGVIDGKLLPYMDIRRERTEILQHHAVTYTTKLPTVIQIHPKKLLRYNTYCGSSVNDFKNATKDDRFARMVSMLAPKEGPDMGAVALMSLDDDNSGYASDDCAGESYTHFGGRSIRRFRRDQPVVVFPTISKSYVSSPEFEGGVTDNKVRSDLQTKDVRGLKENSERLRESTREGDSDANAEGRFHSPTLKKSFGVRSGRAK